MSSPYTKERDMSSTWKPAPPAAKVIADANLPFDLEPGQRAYIAKVCADRRVKDVWIKSYSLGGSILLRWDMRFRDRGGLQYYRPQKDKTLTRRVRLACDECGGTGKGDGTNIEAARGCVCCTKWHRVDR